MTKTLNVCWLLIEHKYISTVLGFHHNYSVSGAYVSIKFISRVSVRELEVLSLWRKGCNGWTVGQMHFAALLYLAMLVPHFSLIGCQHFNIVKFHIKIRVSGFSWKSRRSGNFDILSWEQVSLSWLVTSLDTVHWGLCCHCFFWESEFVTLATAVSESCFPNLELLYSL